jgi:hypothetical protein
MNTTHYKTEGQLHTKCLYIGLDKLSIYNRVLPTVGGSAQHLIVLPSTKTDSSAQHKNTPQIFVNMKNTMDSE